MTDCCKEENGVLNRVLTAYQSIDTQSLDGIYEERYLAHYRKYCENMEKRNGVDKIKKRAKEIQSSRSLKKINSMDELKMAVKEGIQGRITSITINDGELWSDFEFLVNTLKDCKFLVYLKIENIDGYEFKYESYYESKSLDELFSAIESYGNLKTVVFGSPKMNRIKMLIEKAGSICEIE